MKALTRFTLAALATAALVPATASAQIRSVSGTKNGFTFEATNTIIGRTSSATVAGGGDPIFLAQSAPYRGIVGLLMDYGAGGQFVCSGSLTNGGKSIVTAAHCVSDGTAARPNSVTAFFYDGNASDPVVYAPGAVGVTTVAISNITVNPFYTGEVIDQNDVAVLQLAGRAPSFATIYDIYNGGDLTGEAFNVAGYGRRSDTGGSVGANLGTGRLRQGDNRYDFRFGDADFGGFFTDRDAAGDNFFGQANIDFTYVSDFDNGLVANDASCLIAGAFNLGGRKYCNVGVGLGVSEVGISGGDSGGPGFVNGQLASVNSFGLSFGRSFGDVDGALNSSYGEFSGYVPLSIHRNFLQAAFAVPEPGTWMMMIMGFGVIGASMRRRQTKVTFANA